MAETRAIARALRLAVNVGSVCLEELADDADEDQVGSPVVANGGRVSNGTTGPAAGPARSPARQRGRDNMPEEAAAGDVRAMSPEQRRYLFRLAYGLGESRETALARVLESLGVADIDQATRVQAVRAIDALKIEAAAQDGDGIANQNGVGHA